MILSLFSSSMLFVLFAAASAFCVLFGFVLLVHKRRHYSIISLAVRSFCVGAERERERATLLSAERHEARKRERMPTCFNCDRSRI